MTSVKITDLTAYTDAASTDVLPIVDVGADVTKKIAIGDIVKAVPQGTAALPGLAFDGDPNTGLFSAGADQVGLATNGTGRLFIDASGRVGVGTTPNASSIFQAKAATNSHVAIWDYSATPMILGLTDAGASQSLRIAGFPLTFTGNGGAGSEHARITSDGKLGLGTSSPSSEFHAVGGSLYSAIKTGSTVYIGNTGTGIHGRLGVVNSSGFGIQAAWTGDNNGYNLLLNPYGGNVGIGTTSPSTLLHLSQSSSGAAVVSRIENTNTAADSDAALDLKTPNAVYTLKAKRSGTRCDFEVDGSPKLSIDTSGRLLIGTSTARTNIDYAFGTTAAPFQVERADALPCAAIVSNYDSATVGAPAYFTLARTGSTAIGSTTIVADGNYLGEIDFSGSDGTNFTIAASIRGEVDGTPGANDMPGRLVFSTTPDGSATPAEVMRITSDKYVRLASGTGGIQFNGDTAAANALDDYEEGTWTPTIVGTATTGTGTYTIQSALYTKVGNSVTIQGYVSWSAHTGTGGLALGNLPFTTNGTYYSHLFAFTNDIALSANYYTAGLETSLGATSAPLYHAPIGGGVVTGVPMDSAGTLYFGGTYFV